MFYDFLLKALEHWPQLVMLFLFAISILGAAEKHGEKKKPPFDRTNFWHVCIRVGVIGGLLYAGGFFK